MINEFYYFGKNCVIASGELSVKNPQKIYIGDNCVISKNVEMTVNEKSNGLLEYNLKFGDNSFINSSSKLEAKNYLEIGKHVSIGPYVYISDIEHEYEDFTIPVRQQGIKTNANKVIIKDGTWIGSGVKIVGDIKIGYGCVVGANSIVKADIPDHCVVIGAPAKVLKVCDYRTGKWIRVDGNIEVLEQVLKSRGKFKGYKHYELQTAKSKYAKKENNRLNQKEINNDDLLEIYIFKFENFLNDLYDIVIRAYEETIEVSFNDIIQIIEQIESSFLEIIKISFNKKPYEDFIKTFNECLNSVVESYNNKNKESFIVVLENTLIEIIKNVKTQLELDKAMSNEG